MKKMELVKKSTIALSSIFIISSVAPSFVDAATAYKVKSGKLVTAKTSKKVKGVKLYKGTLYKNGVKVKGYTLYKSTLYNNGKKKTGNKVYKSTLYVNGKKSKGFKVVSSTLYNNGKKATGYKAYKNVLYYNGKKKTGYKLNANILYYNGAKFTGTYSSKYYKTGKVFTGYRTVSSTKYYYKNGAKLTGLYQNTLYVKGVLNKGPYVFKDILYTNGNVENAVTNFAGKLYSGGKLATGIFTIDNKQVEYVNGVVRGAPDVTTPPKDPVTEPPETVDDIDKLTPEQLIKYLQSINITTVNADNMDKVTALLAAYEKLSLAERKGLEATMTKLQSDLDAFKATLNLSIDAINNKKIYSSLTENDLVEVLKIINAYNALSDTEKKSVTYPIAELKALYTVYSFNTNGYTVINSTNYKKANELLDLYKTLSVEDKEKVQTAYDKLVLLVENYAKLNKTDFTIITSFNFDMAETALANYDDLTAAEKALLPYTKVELQNKIAAYKFDVKALTITTVNNSNELKAAKDILDEYEKLSSSIKQYLKFSTEEVTILISVYNFTVSTQNLNVENAADAEKFYNLYRDLLPEVKVRLSTSVKETYEAVQLTIELSNLRTLLANVKDSTISAGNVNTAKDGIAAFQKAKPEVLAKLGYTIDSLKQNVAYYDLNKYYTEVAYPAFIKSVYTTGVGRPEITLQEVPYMMKMFVALETSKQKDFYYKLLPIMNVANSTLKPNLLGESNSLLDITPSKGYTIKNLDNETYNGMAYNYEKTFKFTASLPISGGKK